MAERRFNKHFDAAWWFTVAGFLAVGVLPTWVPWAGWPGLALGLLALFLVAEYVSQAVGRSTLTAWLFWRLEEYKVARILVGVLFALIAWERLPDWGVWYITFNRVVGVFLMAWLPMHYTERGFRGPIEDFFYDTLGVRLW